MPTRSVSTVSLPCSFQVPCPITGTSAGPNLRFSMRERYPRACAPTTADHFPRLRLLYASPVPTVTSQVSPL